MFIKNNTLLYVMLVIALLCCVVCFVNLAKRGVQVEIRPPYGTYQSSDEVQARYDKCWNEAKRKNMDCFLQPIMVSREFMESHK